MPVEPTLRDLWAAALGSAAFIALGVAMLRWGNVPTAMMVVAWLSVGFGAMGLLGVAFRSSGRTLGPSHEVLERKRRTKASARPIAIQAPVHRKGPLPELSPRKQAEVRRIVRAMAERWRCAGRATSNIC